MIHFFLGVPILWLNLMMSSMATMKAESEISRTLAMCQLKVGSFLFIDDGRGVAPVDR